LQDVFGGHRHGFMLDDGDAERAGKNERAESVFRT
jgi:hypothetical protein